MADNSEPETSSPYSFAPRITQPAQNNTPAQLSNSPVDVDGSLMRLTVATFYNACLILLYTHNYIRECTQRL